MSRVIDIRCTRCDHTQRDVRLVPGEYPFCPACRVPMERWWTSGSSAAVIGDECDVTINHGICNEDGTPRRYRSKSEMRHVAASKNLVNVVEHIGRPGSDKSSHTTRWI